MNQAKGTRKQEADREACPIKLERDYSVDFVFPWVGSCDTPQAYWVSRREHAGQNDRATGQELNAIHGKADKTMVPSGESGHEPALI